MKRTYSCPKCQAILNPGAKIVLRAEIEGHRGLFLFSPQPGNYDVVIPEGFGLRDKDTVTFGCPVCGHDLTSAREPTMAEIGFAAPAGVSGTVAFSRIAGRHATYFITQESVKPYGEHADSDAVNFWGAGPES